MGRSARVGCGPLPLGQPSLAVAVADDAADEQPDYHGADGQPARRAVEDGVAGVPPSRQQVGERGEGHAGREPPARGPDRQAVQRAPPGDRPAAELQVMPGVEVQHHDGLGGHPGYGRIALPERHRGADDRREQRAQDLRMDRAGPLSQASHMT